MANQFGPRLTLINTDRKETLSKAFDPQIARPDNVAAQRFVECPPTDPGRLVSEKFQVHLRGLIDLLSNHLYSGPQVFVRELLQNGVDAITARKRIDPDFAGQIDLELTTAPARPPTLTFSDNGIGLTEAEVHQFLAVIGESSKRGQLGERPTDFLGQFGIGLLACFLVSDEIIVVTRSATGSPAVEWRGRPDGTYQVKTLSRDLAPGTQVFLVAKPDREVYFTSDRLTELVRHYGGLLPVPIRLLRGSGVEALNSGTLPWAERGDGDEQRAALLAFGEEMFDTRFLDVVPLRAEAGAVDGVAFVLPHSPSPAAKRADRVYLKRMLLSESADNLLPDWAFFVKAIVNADGLRPTASRESFYEDDRLIETREDLGDCLRNYLVNLARRRPEMFRALLSVHQLALEALAIQDDECFDLFIDWLPFETAEGRMTLPEFLKRHETIRVVADLDQFRQIAPIAAAQGLGVVNAGYVYTADLLSKYAERRPEAKVVALDATEVAQSLTDLEDDERDAAHDFLVTAEAVLRPQRCAIELRKFQPKELTAIFNSSSEGRLLRSIEQSQQVADSLWSGVLDTFAKNQLKLTAAGQLCFNFENRLIRRLIDAGDTPASRRAIQVLYVQAILHSHHPLSQQEWKILNEGLLALVEESLK